MGGKSGEVSGLRDERKLDAFAHRIDPFSAHADLIAEVPFELAGLCAAATPGAGGSAATSTRQGYDGVIALAKHASRAGKFLECADWKKTLHEDFEKLDKTAVFLYGNDQLVVFLAEVLLHELSGFPIHQFALGAIGAALRFGRFCSDFFEVPVRVERGLRPRRSGHMRLRRGWNIMRMIEGPFQNAMHD